MTAISTTRFALSFVRGLGVRHSVTGDWEQDFQRVCKGLGIPTLYFEDKSQQGPTSKTPRVPSQSWWQWGDFGLDRRTEVVGHAGEAWLIVECCAKGYCVIALARHFDLNA